jgi:Uma2 family endonuclease
VPGRVCVLPSTAGKWRSIISGEQSYYGRMLGRLFCTLAEELDIPIKSYGACTLKRKDIERGMEADQWYYTTNEWLVRGKRDLDLPLDPPPDLAFEIPILQTVLSRTAVYAALGVGELWRFDGQSLVAYRLRADGTYEKLQSSPTLPGLSLDELVRFVHMDQEMSETALIRLFRAWVREHILPTWRTPAQS